MVTKNTIITLHLKYDNNTETIKQGTNAFKKKIPICFKGIISEYLHFSLFLKYVTLYGTDHKPSTIITLMAKPNGPKTLNKENDKANCNTNSISIRLTIIFSSSKDTISCV